MDNVETECMKLKPDERTIELLEPLDGRGSDQEWQAIGELRARLGDRLVSALYWKYRMSKSWQARCSCVYFCFAYARNSTEAVELGIEALRDRSKVVRNRACQLLAYSLDRSALPALRAAVESGGVSVGDFLAAIDAIENQNHNFFVDRDHSGMVTMDMDVQTSGSLNSK